jgi:hypothetical protein
MATQSCPVNNLTTVLLDGYLGRDIAALCPHGFTDSSLNHCAHFVCHVLNLKIGVTSCRVMGKQPQADRIGVGIRVHEVFAACPEVGLFSGCSADRLAAGVLVFVTSPQAVNLGTQTMGNVPRKHIGIAINDTIWHYSNTQDKVVTATSQQFRRHYSSQTNELYFGLLPPGAEPTPLGCGR